MFPALESGLVSYYNFSSFNLILHKKRYYIAINEIKVT